MAGATKHDVELWIKTIVTGEFHYTEVLDKQIDPQYYGRLRKIMHDLCKAEVIEPVGRRDGFYRVIQDGVRPVEWQNLQARRDSGLLLPFDLRKYVFIYPDTTIVVAGSKSSGKTGFLYRTVVLNMERVVTILLTNLEGGLSQLRDRFCAMDVAIPEPAPFIVLPVNENYHDYIKKPNTLYVIDYIDAPNGEEFYKIGGLIKKIDQKLQGLNSNAVIGLQKPFGRDTAFGNEQTLKTATLYVAMDSHKLKIVDAKVPTDKKVHPKNMQWTFHYEDEGTRFINIQQSYESV
jgi:hypothetical protein